MSSPQIVRTNGFNCIHVEKVVIARSSEKCVIGVSALLHQRDCPIGIVVLISAAYTPDAPLRLMRMDLFPVPLFD